MTTKPSSAKPAPLGRGLSALFGDTDTSYKPAPVSIVAARRSDAGAEGAGSSADGAPRAMPIAWIQPGAYQPRRRFDEAAIAELASSIRERGVLQPLMVRPLPGEKDSYEIIAGERRWRAAQKAGLHEVPVMIRRFTDREAMEIGLIENVQRQDLSPMEEAEGYKRLLDEFQHTQDGLAKVVGKSRPHISNMLRLLTLPDPVKDLVNSGELSMGHARAVITAKDPLALAREIVKKGMSVRQAEAMAKRDAEGKGQKQNLGKPGVDPDVLALEMTLSQQLGMKVKLHVSGAGGTLSVQYKDLDQLDALIARLKT